MSTSSDKLTVRDILMPLDKIPVVSPDTLFKETLESMTDHRLGMACIVDSDGGLLGIFTDGDARRMLLRSQKPFPALFADDIAMHMKANPATINMSASITEAIEMLENNEIWDLPVVDGENKLAGLIHLHPTLKALLGR